MSGPVQESDDDVTESQGQLIEDVPDGGINMSDIRVAQNESDEEVHENSPFKNMQASDDEADLAPNNAAGATAKSLVALASLKGKVIARRKGVKRSNMNDKPSELEMKEIILEPQEKRAAEKQTERMQQQVGGIELRDD